MRCSLLAPACPPLIPADYCVHETLRHGRAVTIRALHRDDRDAMLEAAGRLSAEAMALRFFAPKRGFSEREIDYYVNVDFVGHVALVATLDAGSGAAIVGGGRYIVAAPGSAEIAFSVDDTVHGEGLAGLLLEHLAILARAAGVRQFVAEVLPSNAAMLKVFERSGLAMRRTHADGVVHVTLSLA